MNLFANLHRLFSNMCINSLECFNPSTELLAVGAIFDGDRAFRRHNIFNQLRKLTLFKSILFKFKVFFVADCHELLNVSARFEHFGTRNTRQEPIVNMLAIVHFFLLRFGFLLFW